MNKGICHQYLKLVVRSVDVNTSNKSISRILGFLSVACGLHHVQCTATGFELPLLSCLGLAPQNGDHHTLISHFTGVNFLFFTASAGLPHSPSSPLPHPRSPIGMCAAQCCLLDWAFRGVSVSPWQLLAPCASPSGGWPTARRPQLHTPFSIPLRTLTPSTQPFAWPWLKPVALIGYQIPV